MASTLSTFDAFIKEYYTDQKVEDLTKSGKPLYGRIRKNEDVSGDPWVVPILWSNPQGVAAYSLANAQTAGAGVGGNVSGSKWAITMANYQGTVSIGDKVLMASRNNVGSFLEDKTTEIDGLYETVANSHATYLYRNGGGAVGQISVLEGAVGSNKFSLVNPSDAFNFEYGMYVRASATDGSDTSGTPRTGSTYVTSVDAVNGIIGVNSVAGITAVAAGDYVFRLGDVVGDTGTLLMHGVQAFITSSTSPGTLWGVTRTTQVQRLSGCKVPTSAVTGKGIEERLQLLGAYMAGRYRAMTAGGTYECYCHPEDWQTLEISLQARGQRSLTEDETQFGYEYISANLGGKKVKIFSDPYCPVGSAFLLRMDNWQLGSYGQLIRNVAGDGLSMLRAASTNDYEYRLISYPEVACNAPGFSGWVPMPTP